MALDCTDQEAIDKSAGHDRDAKVDHAKCFTQCDGLIFFFCRTLLRQDVPGFSSIVRKIFSSNAGILTSGQLNLI